MSRHKLKIVNGYVNCVPPWVLQVGSADNNIYYYDSRNTSQAVHKLEGHRKSVCHVEFSSSNNLVSASIDSSLRLWDIQKCAPVSDCTRLDSCNVDLCITTSS